jgi:hypothetical protein
MADDLPLGRCLADAACPVRFRSGKSRVCRDHADAGVLAAPVDDHKALWQAVIEAAPTRRDRP